jgi:NAD(P)H-nitrite reductase large subunit
VTTSTGIVIVGGGLAAVRTAEELRRADYTGPITIIGDEKHLPYDRPPLSKDVLRAATDNVTLKPAEFYADNDITLRLGSGVTTLDTNAQTVTVANGNVVSYFDLKNPDCRDRGLSGVGVGVKVWVVHDRPEVDLMRSGRRSWSGCG